MLIGIIEASRKINVLVNYVHRRELLMTNEEFETRKKEIADDLQLLLDEMRQLHDWIVLNPVIEITQKNYKDWENSFDALHSSFKILGHEF